MKNTFLTMTNASNPSIKRAFKTAQEAYHLHEEMGVSYRDIADKLSYSPQYMFILVKFYKEWMEKQKAEVEKAKVVIEEVKVSDIACISYLIYKGFEEQSIGRNGDGRVAYFFSGTPEFHEALIEFWDEKGEVEPKAFAALIRKVKYSIYSYQNPQAAQYEQQRLN